jgi:hypothetical protein
MHHCPLGTKILYPERPWCYAPQMRFRIGIRRRIHGAQAGRRSCLSTQVVNAAEGRGLFMG